MNRHTDKPPDLQSLVGLLARYGVSFVVVGSAAARMLGLDVVPRDLDIAPDMNPTNLVRLADALGALEASVALTNVIGHWEYRDDGTNHWVSRPATPDEQQQLETLLPDVDEPATFDHMFFTAAGNLDIVPVVAGTYEELMKQAIVSDVLGHNVRVAHVNDLLHALTAPRRRKDVPRIDQLRNLQRALAAP